MIKVVPQTFIYTNDQDINLDGMMNVNIINKGVSTVLINGESLLTNEEYIITNPAGTILSGNLSFRFISDNENDCRILFKCFTKATGENS